MSFFDKFTDTIFLKSDSNLDEKIQVLTELNKKYPNDERISKDLLLAKLGSNGEKEIEFELKSANIGMYVLHDIYIEYNDLTAQIDYVVITPAGNYFIECKNLIGNIIVNERGDFIREYSIKNKTIKEGIYSPLRQAERHIEVYKKIRDANMSTLNKIILFNNDRFYEWNKPLVVTANEKNILNTKYAPKDIKKKIIKSDQLVAKITEDINSTPKESRSTKKDMETIANLILNRSTQLKKDYYQEYEQQDNPESNINMEDIRDKLKQFRTKKSQEKKHSCLLYLHE